MRTFLFIPALFLALILTTAETSDARCFAFRPFQRLAQAFRPLRVRRMEAVPRSALPKYRIECDGNSCRRVRMN